MGNESSADGASHFVRLFFLPLFGAQESPSADTPLENLGVTENSADGVASFIRSSPSGTYVTPSAAPLRGGT